MYQIICPECSNATKFENLNKRPEECSFCFASFSKEIAFEDIEDDRGKLYAMELKCQNTNEIIRIEGDYNLLGRQCSGGNVLSNIFFNGVPVISRKHCSISLIDGKYYLKDEGSTNGTYYGVNKIDCSKKVCEIKNESLIFLGQEAFLVKFIFEKKEPNNKVECKANQKPKMFRCNEGCGYQSEKYEEICPNCMTSNSMIEVN